MRGARRVLAIILVFGAFVVPLRVLAADTGNPSAVAVGAQYGTTHVYVASQDHDRFVQSFLATFGGSKSKPALTQITPTPSQTMWQAVTTPAGVLSVFAFKSPIPYPFGSERTGYLVTDMDIAVKSAVAHGADLQVAVFPDAIGRDAIIEWPGGVRMQLYWHATPPQAPPLKTIPENRVYVSPVRADAFINGFLAFAQGKIISDEADAPGIEVGQSGGTTGACASTHCSEKSPCSSRMVICPIRTAGKSWATRFRTLPRL